MIHFDHQPFQRSVADIEAVQQRVEEGEDRVTQFIFIVSRQYDFTEPPPICFAILMESHMRNLTAEGELGQGGHLVIVVKFQV